MHAHTHIHVHTYNIGICIYIYICIPIHIYACFNNCRYAIHNESPDGAIRVSDVGIMIDTGSKIHAVARDWVYKASQTIWWVYCSLVLGDFNHIHQDYFIGTGVIIGNFTPEQPTDNWIFLLPKATTPMCRYTFQTLAFKVVLLHFFQVGHVFHEITWHRPPLIRLPK